jgi:WD40 repeat protein
MRRFLIMLWIAMMLVVAAIPAQGQNSDACATMTQHWSDVMGYTIGRPFVRYAPYTQQVVMMEGKSRKDVQVVETDLAADHFYAELSPDCRYLAAAIALPNGKSQMVAWDLLTNARISTVEDAPSAYRLQWSPVGTTVIAESHDGAYLWNISADQWLLLNPPGDYGNFYSYFTWDTARNQLLVVPGNAGHTVQAYDLTTGQVAAVYDSGTPAIPVSYILSDDRSKIAVFTSEGDGIRDGQASGLAVWDRDSGAKMVLKAETLAAVWLSQVRFSPDNHYLVIARDTIRVWDLNNPNAYGLPTYQYDGPDARIGTVRFADAGTLETLSVVSCNVCSSYWLRWNLATGEFVNAYDEPRDRIVKGFELE